MDSARFSRRELAFLIGVPLVWAVLLLFHPTGDGEAITYADVQDVVTRWLIVHIGMLIFIPLMAGVVYLRQPLPWSRTSPAAPLSAAHSAY